MTMAEIRIKKWGNSMGLIIPNEITKIEEFSEGEVIKVDFIKNRRISGFGMLKGTPRFKRDKDEHDDLW